MGAYADKVAERMGQSPAGGETTPTTEPITEPKSVSGFDPAMLGQVEQGVQPDQPVAEPEGPSWLQQAGASMVESLSFINPLATSVEDAKEGTSGTAFGGALADFASFGTADAMAAAGEATKRWMTEGAEWSEAYADEKDEVNAALAYNSVEYPMATLGGATVGGILGSLMPGAAAEKATRGLGWIARGLAVTPAAASGEAALYRYNSDGTKSEIMFDAGVAALAGVAFGITGSFLGNRLANLRGKNTSSTEKVAAQEMLDAINLKTTARGEPALTAEQLSTLMKERGVEAVMADFYPEMQPLIRRTMSVPNSDGAKTLVALLGARNELGGSFQTAIADATAAPRSRSVKEFSAFIKDRQKRIQPKYDAVLDGIESAGLNFKPKGILDSIKNSYSTTPLGDSGQMKSATKSFAKILRSKTENGKVTARALHNAKREFYAANKSNPAARRVYDLTTDWLSRADPDYAKLSRTYSNTINQEKAYKVGYEYFTGKKQGPSAVREMATSFSTYAEATAFANGARRKLAEDLRGKSPEAVKKFLVQDEHKIEMLRAAIGPENTDKLLGSVMAEYAIESTRSGIEKSIKAAQKPDRTGSDKLKQATDAAISMFSPGASPGAVRAKLATLFPKDIAAPTTAADLIGRLATSPLDSRPAILRELERMSGARSRKGTMGRAITLGGAVGAAATEGTKDTVLQRETEDYLNRLEE